MLFRQSVSLQSTRRSRSQIRNHTYLTFAPQAPPGGGRRHPWTLLAERPQEPRRAGRAMVMTHTSCLPPVGRCRYSPACVTGGLDAAGVSHMYAVFTFYFSNFTYLYLDLFDLVVRSERSLVVLCGPICRGLFPCVVLSNSTPCFVEAVLLIQCCCKTFKTLQRSYSNNQIGVVFFSPTLLHMLIPDPDECLKREYIYIYIYIYV